MKMPHHRLCDWLRSVIAWTKEHGPTTYAIVGTVLILIASGITFALLTKPLPPLDTTPIPIKPRPKPKYYAPLTGEQVKAEADTTKPVTAIMIENSPDARPQSGLKNAEVVYEAVAEGGITRFLALYQQHKPQLIGPVRSVRMYYVDWLTPYNASVAHIGGSYKALQVVRNGSYRDIDQFFNPDYYWRATDRYAPHNVYTSFAKLDVLNKSKGYKTSHPKVMARGDVETPKKLDATTVSVNISGPTYNSTYSYDTKTGLYARSQAGAPHLDREKGRITAKVVVALQVSMEQVFEDGYRESIKTSGTGTAYVFQNGHVTKVTWRKDSRASQLSFSSADGKPFILARGTTWISAVPTDGGSVSWK
ncbi:hypothetical protein RAAC3_TM7C00001G0656 [Candidatus Saccharibacteria bacterium RAAC3_TM7_1]|nr:hypothetical protein RAAC3_TM7C00001G0656 [Candidatus Saccharibacteria bacterium RAAC3_TM7_1]HCZ28629.1 DUF3048 domain-containing protein [Candidatus Saccharibacteria bacterium]